jgi:hypothetical protein
VTRRDIFTFPRFLVPDSKVSLLPPSRSVPPPAAPGLHGPAGAPGRGAHFRSHDRRPVRLAVNIVGQRSGADRQALVIDLSLAGAGIETEEPLVPGDRISVTFATPTLWDPLVLTAVVAWAHSPRATTEVDAFGRPRSIARAGLVFDYPDPATVLAMFEMLTTLGYE